MTTHFPLPKRRQLSSPDVHVASPMDIDSQSCYKIITAGVSNISYTCNEACGRSGNHFVCGRQAHSFYSIVQGGWSGQLYQCYVVVNHHRAVIIFMLNHTLGHDILFSSLVRIPVVITKTDCVVTWSSVGGKG